jgi:hypothetical protein
MSDRRFADRASLGHIFVNKYVDGLPHIAALVDLSPSGCLIRKILEPLHGKSFYSLELEIPWRSERLWLWARCVRESNGVQALRFVGTSEEDREILAAVVREVRQAA